MRNSLLQRKKTKGLNGFGTTFCPGLILNSFQDYVVLCPETFLIGKFRIPQAPVRSPVQ